MLLLTALTSAALADPTPVKVSGLLFPQWTMDLTEGAGHASAFGFERTYLRAERKITDRISARITLDSDMGDAGEGYQVYVKHAWVQWTANDALTVRGGVVDTPMIPFLSDWQRLRWVNKTFLADNDLGSSADLGVNVAGRHADGLVTWMAGVYNGEGYKTPEIDAGKSVQGRVTVDPLAARGPDVTLPLTVFAEENVRDGEATLTWAGDVGFKHPHLFVGAELAGTSKAGRRGFGQSGQVAPGHPRYGFLLVRVDHWDPDTATPGDDTLMLLVGPAHAFHERVSLGAFFERVVTPGVPGTAEQSASLRGQVGF